MNTNRVRSWQQEYVQPERKESKVVVRVKRKGWLTKGEKVIYSFAAFLLIIFCCYLVSYSSKLDQINREVQSLQHSVEQQVVENKSLDYEVRELSKPDRITKIDRKSTRLNSSHVA